MLNEYGEPEVEDEGDGSIKLDLGVPVKTDSSVFHLPLAALPEAMTEEGVVLAIKLFLIQGAYKNF